MALRLQGLSASPSKTMAEVSSVAVQEPFKLDVLDGGPVEGFVGFFDVQFRGSPESPADFPVRTMSLMELVGIANMQCVMTLSLVHFAQSSSLDGQQLQFAAISHQCSYQ